MERTQTVVVLPDTHFPFEDKRTWPVVKQYISDTRPHKIIMLGDIGDFGQISKYNTDAPEELVRSLREDFDYINAELDDLAARAPRAEIILIEGNHDFRIEKFIQKNPQLRGVLDVPVQLNIAKRSRFTWVPYWSQGTLYQVGNAYFIHGRWTNKYHAFKHVDAYGTNVFYGHTHDVMSFPKVLHGKDRTLVGQSLGCLCDYDQPYLQGAPTNWQQAFGVFRFNGDWFNHYVVRIFNNSFVSPEGWVYKG